VKYTNETDSPVDLPAHGVWALAPGESTELPDPPKPPAGDAKKPAPAGDPKGDE
jgi:hypothetical protein